MTNGEASAASALAGREDRSQLTQGLVLGTCFAFGLFGKGAVETFGVFLLPLIQEFGWPRAAVTGIYAIIMLAIGLFGPLAGILFDRWGARRIYGAGVAVLAGGFLTASFSGQLWQLYLVLGLAGGFGVASIGNVPATALVGRWFSGRMGFAMGVIWAATGLGTLILIPAAQMLIDLGGWRFAYRMLALILAGLGLLVALMPWQEFETGQPRRPVGEDAQHRAPEGMWTLKRALKEKMFWAMFLVFFFTSVGVFAVQVQIVAYLIEIGINRLTAATAVGFAGLAASFGQMLFGWLGDRLGRRRALTLSYGCTLFGLLSLSLLQSHPAIWLIAAYVLSFGLTMGSRGPQIAAVAAKEFGGKSLGGIFGALTIGMGLGSAVGSSLGGLLHDWTGDYQVVFAASFLSILLALSPWWLWPRLRQI